MPGDIESRKLIIVDGNALMHRAFHAMPPLSTKSGEPINAVHGLVSMFLKVIQDLKPDFFIVAFDEKEKTFRQFALPSYQAQRPPMPPELSSQFDKAKLFLAAAKIPVYSMPGYEADDVIGTLSQNFKGEVVVVTGDRDILQLVDDNKKVRLYMPITGLSNAKLYKEAETVERLGVAPKQIPDYKALVGDASDNYFGVPGIGPKTATNLLEKYKTVDGIYSHIDDLPEKLKEKLVNGKDSAMLSYKLATIILDVPIKIKFDEAQNWDIDSPEAIKLFEEFGFKTLTERVKKMGKELDNQNQGSLF